VTSVHLAHKALTIAIIAGESSGDQLGVRLMRALREQATRPVSFIGVGGPLMVEEGLVSLFPMSDIAVNGVFPVLKKLPTLLQRISMAAVGVAAAKPDVVVHIDAQDFNQRVARKLRKLIPDTPLVGYVSPTVWAWRAGRARKIRPLFRKLLAVLPFEPEVHQKLGGPETIYVGHPLMERRADWTRTADDITWSASQPYQLLVLPGSRRSEVERLLPLFGDAVARLATGFPGLRPVIPAVAHLKDLIGTLTSQWKVQPEIVLGEAAKWQAFRTARAAIAASGTVTLELALAQVPSVVAYRVSWIEGVAGRVLIRTPFASLPNIILGEALIPEFLDRNWDGNDLAQAAESLLRDTGQRVLQLSGFRRIGDAMNADDTSPSVAAAREVIDLIKFINK
jgi:lipid-A-disaccharide synthase